MFHHKTSPNLGIFREVLIETIFVLGDLIGISGVIVKVVCLNKNHDVQLLNRRGAHEIGKSFVFCGCVFFIDKPLFTSARATRERVAKTAHFRKS